MNMPGFNAESALGPTMSIYQGMVGGSGASKDEVSMQQLGASSIPGRFGATMRCCGYSTLLRRFVCTTQTVSPFEQCECLRTPFGPIILCQPPVFSPG